MLNLLKMAYNWKGKKNLIVEDDDSTNLYYHTILESTGARIIIARDAEEALTHLHFSNCDIILLDIRLPDMNGYDLAREIRKSNEKIPIVVQTAYAFHYDKQKAVAAGCNEYCTKPVNARLLCSIIDKYLK